MALVQNQPVSYEQRLVAFIANIERVKQMYPREDYLYQILNTPLFSDLETALMMAELEYTGNPNHK